MSHIKKMDHRLSNMIAAGEVVERPSSVIKELVENALDAHATKINIEVEGFGMQKMIVTDNGDGMDHIDAKLAFERYATSKIKNEMDLSHIATLGFRGEALAAISAVSKVTLKTKKNDTTGVKVVYEGGHFIEQSEAATNEGTCIEVSNLFYNTPARFKYIKSEYSEKYAIIDMFDRLALANPDVAFSLYFDHKLHKETFGKNDYYQLIDQIYGKQLTKDLTIATHDIKHMSIKAYLVSPQIVRSRKKDISIFINRRYIKNYRLSKAVIDGYHSFLMVSKFPIAIIDIQMDPSLLDVNVHPQKFEVKFVNESFLAFELEQMIKRALQQKTHTIQENLSFVKQEVKPKITQEHIAFDTLYETNQVKPEIKLEEQYQDKPISIENNKPMFNENQSLENHQVVSDVNKENSKPNKLPYLEYIGIFSGTYLLFQNKEGLYLMDQHAAAERIRYEHYYEALGNPVFAVKERLIPYELSLSNDDIDKLLTFEKVLKPYGFHFQNKMLIATPTWLKENDIDIAIESILKMLDEDKRVSIKTLRDDLAKDVSCKGAIKANHYISRQEVFQLIKDLRTCHNPYTCPHGRPTLIKITHYEIERMFKRVV